MLEFTFVVCLMIAPQDCEERRELLLPEIGLVGCMVTAQARLARWSDSNPAFRIARWSCGWAEPSAVAA